MIELYNIKVAYGGRTIIDIPELQFESGKRYAIIGTNGSGKSTLLKIIAGTIQPDCGNIQIPSEIQKLRGYMPQHPYIFGFSVLRNVTMALQNKETANFDAVSALKVVGMESFVKESGSSLSGGEAQRMAVARMIAQPRKLLLLDEPTSATDIAGNDLVENALLNYAEKTGCILVIATHSPAQARRLAEQIIMLDHGAVVENGPADEVLHRPKSEQGIKFLQHWKLKGK